MGVVGAVGGGGQTIPVRRLFGSCTVLYKERKEIEVVYTTDSIVNSPLSQKDRNFTLDFFDKRSRLISNYEKVYLFRL